jgi:hypothetical protein
MDAIVLLIDGNWVMEPVSSMSWPGPGFSSRR